LEDKLTDEDAEYFHRTKLMRDHTYLRKVIEILEWGEDKADELIAAEVGKRYPKYLEMNKE